MSAAFYEAGFDVWDMAMADLLGKIVLMISSAAFVGGLVTTS
jgi:hypothetical protein